MATRNQQRVRRGEGGEARGRGMRWALGAGVACAVAGVASPASARSFVELTDDGTVAAPSTKGFTASGQDVLAERVVAWYKATGMPLPEVISLWTTFDMDGNDSETLIDPLANDVTGIGLQTQVGGDGTFASSYPPVRAILLHNTVLKLAARAKLQDTTVTGFPQYLFLLEFSHQWGPALQLPVTNEADGGGASDLIGFPYHWSFWMAAGGSPAGGNPWQDAGAGSFSVSGWSPSAIRYSMLDLYVMGLAASSEVPPFGVIEDAVPPSGLIDPLFDAPYGAESFPWFGTTTFTATGSMRTVTMDDVVAANGKRSPDVSTSSKVWTVGVGLVVSKSDSAATIAQAEALVEPIAASLPSTFQTATQGRGTLTLLSVEADAGAADAAADAPAASEPPEDAGTVSTPPTTGSPSEGTKSSGCSVGGDPSTAAFAFGLPIAALAVVRRRRRVR